MGRCVNVSFIHNASVIRTIWITSIGPQRNYSHPVHAWMIPRLGLRQEPELTVKMHFIFWQNKTNVLFKYPYACIPYATVFSFSLCVICFPFNHMIWTFKCWIVVCILLWFASKSLKFNKQGINIRMRMTLLTENVLHTRTLRRLLHSISDNVVGYLLQPQCIIITQCCDREVGCC